MGTCWGMILVFVFASMHLYLYFVGNLPFAGLAWDCASIPELRYPRLHTQSCRGLRGAVGIRLSCSLFIQNFFFPRWRFWREVQIEPRSKPNGSGGSGRFRSPLGASRSFRRVLVRDDHDRSEKSDGRVHANPRLSVLLSPLLHSLTHPLGSRCILAST